MEKTSGLLGWHKKISGEKTFQLKCALSFVDAKLSLRPEKASCIDFSEHAFQNLVLRLTPVKVNGHQNLN